MIENAQRSAARMMVAVGSPLASYAGMHVMRVIARLRNEFTAMPGLCLTVPQAQRLLAVDAPTATSALHCLVSSGFLSRIDPRTYGRTDIFITGRTRCGCVSRDAARRERVSEPDRWDPAAGA